MNEQFSERTIYLQLSTVTQENFTNFVKIRDYANESFSDLNFHSFSDLAKIKNFFFF